jgi:hypothetical protein
MDLTIKSLGNGWYSFKEIPQEGRYIKIDGLNCGTDKCAIKAAQKHFGKENTYIIK